MPGVTAGSLVTAGSGSRLVSAGVTMDQMTVPNIVQPDGSYERIFISTTGSDSNDGLTNTTPMFSLQAAVSKYRPRYAQFYLANGDYPGDLTVPNGMVLQVYGQSRLGVTMYGLLTIGMCRAYIQNLTVSFTDALATLVDISESQVSFRACSMLMGTSTMSNIGVNALDSTVNVTNCSFDYIGTALQASNSTINLTTTTIASTCLTGIRLSSASQARIGQGTTNLATTPTSVANGSSVFT